MKPNQPGEIKPFVENAFSVFSPLLAPNDIGVDINIKTG